MNYQQQRHIFSNNFVEDERKEKILKSICVLMNFVLKQEWELLAILSYFSSMLFDTRI